ncbi:hypothetical protein KJ965_02685, partial [Patescibacteria group bacterium]|nr:hypothetical protein [Patescibacteria group bacterium]
MKPQRGIANIVLLIGVVLVSLVIPITRNLIQRGVKLPFAVVDDGGGSNPVTPPPPVTPYPGPGPEEGINPVTPPPPVEEPPPPVTVNKDCNNRKHKEVWCQNEIEACECRNTKITCDVCTYGCTGGTCIVKPTPIPITPPKCNSPNSCMNASYCITNTILDPSSCEEGYVCCERKPLPTATPAPIQPDRTCDPSADPDCDPNLPAEVPEPIKCEYSTGNYCDANCWSERCNLDSETGCWSCPEAPITPKEKVTLTHCDQNCLDPSQCDSSQPIATDTDCGLDLVCCQHQPISCGSHDSGDNWCSDSRPCNCSNNGIVRCGSSCLYGCSRGECQTKKAEPPPLPMG